MDIFKQNIIELSKNNKNSDIVERLKSIELPREYSINLSKDNKISLIHNNKQLTSNYSTTDEAKRFIDLFIKESKGENLLGLFSSIASYNHVDYFLSLSTSNKAIIIEKDLALIKLILSSYYFKSLSNVVIISENDFSNLENILHNNIEERDIISLVYIRHVRASSIEKEYYDKVESIYSAIAKEKILSLKTLYYFAPIWAHNVVSNLMKNSGSSIKSFLGSLNNSTPLLLVSAGSSIDLKLKEIKELSKTHFILCLSHAFNTLIKNDIIPDAVITTDGGFYSYPHLFALKNNSDIKVFTTHTSYPNTLLHTDKKNIYYFSHNESFEPMLYKESLYIPMGGSVIMPAVNLAYLLNPSYIVLAGCDFCYLSDKTHSKYSFATVYDYLSSDKIDTFESKKYRRLNVDDNVLCYDNKYRPRSLSLKGYFRHFENLVQNTNKKFYALTEESAKIDNVEMYNMDLAKNLENKKLDYNNIPEKIEKDDFLISLNNFFNEVENNNTQTIKSDIAYIIAPWHADNSKSFEEFKNNIISFKKLLFDI